MINYYSTPHENQQLTTNLNPNDSNIPEPNALNFLYSWVHMYFFYIWKTKNIYITLFKIIEFFIIKGILLFYYTYKFYINKNILNKSKMINNFDEMSEDTEKSFDVCYEFEGAGVVETLAFDILIEEVNKYEEVFIFLRSCLFAGK